MEILQGIKNSGEGQWGEGRGREARPPPSYFPTEMRPEGPKTFFLEAGPPRYLGVWMTAPPPYLKGTWIRH